MGVTEELELSRSELERQELDLVLSSGALSRAPGLSQILTYICEKHFEGSDDEIKEYAVGVDALGRPADFDQKSDAIVRVQVGRLRRRLKQYYEKEGASRSVRIEIPEGAYRPKFVDVAPKRPAPAATVQPAPASQSTPTATAQQPAPALVSAKPSREVPLHSAAGVTGRRLSYLLLAAVVTIAAMAILLTQSFSKSEASAPAVVPAGVEFAGQVAGADSVRILTGLENGEFTDGYGNTWGPDRFFEGGSIIRLTDHPIRGTRDPELYQTRRQGMFSYHIPLAAGVHELRLHFAETHFGDYGAAGFGGEGSRAFRVSLNGKQALRRLDVLGEVGGNAANVKVFTDVSPASDGKLHIDFSPLVGVPILSAIEITPGTPGRIRAIRMVAQPRAYVDPSGNRWEPDRLAQGGQVVDRRTEVLEAEDAELYAGERFGNFSYLIPVPADGSYRVNLHLAEQWIGPNLPGQSSTVPRLFDILCNGVALERGVDVTALAGGSSRALVLSFNGIRPTAQGKIWLTFLPVNNFPIINALEVFQEPGSPGSAQL